MFAVLHGFILRLLMERPAVFLVADLTTAVMTIEAMNAFR
jgi:hypothetical protein